MDKTVEELQEMLHRDGYEKRFTLTEQMLKEESQDFLRAARTLLDRELLATAVDARKQADHYWEGNESAREEGVAEDFSYVGTRVRILNGSLQLEWFRNRTRPDMGNGKQVFSTYIRKGRGYRYSDSLFKKEPKWARDAIEIVENRYELLRKRAAVITALRKNLRDYERLVKECFPDKEEKAANKNASKAEVSDATEEKAQ